MDNSRPSGSNGNSGSNPISFISSGNPRLDEGINRVFAHIGVQPPAGADYSQTTTVQNPFRSLASSAAVGDYCERAGRGGGAGGSRDGDRDGAGANAHTIANNFNR